MGVVCAGEGAGVCALIMVIGGTRDCVDIVEYTYI